VEDSYKHKGLRQNLVKELKSKGIKDQNILSAILTIPRHYFLDKAFAEWAYKDTAFPIDADQTISQPYTVAVQTQLLSVQKGDKILEVGTGSGYQACILSELGAKVYTIERQEKLFKKTNRLLENMGYGRIRTLFGDGYKGAPRFAPFDKILVTAGASEVPETLLSQLKIGGCLVIPVGNGGVQEMKRITRISETKFKNENFGKFKFVPFLKGINKSK
jgi:protein-L-isoaspartate(D-aspartate) O-methyltransferase